MVVLKTVAQFNKVIVGAAFFSIQVLCVCVCLVNASSILSYKV